MQFKRETDFAVRILYCLYRNYEEREFSKPLGLTLSEIATQTKVPKTIAGRLCEYLLNSKMIHLVPWDECSERSFHTTSSLLGFSLKDVIEAVEGNSRIFSIFDKSSVVFEACGDRLKMIEEEVDSVLTEMTFERLFDRKGARTNDRDC